MQLRYYKSAPGNYPYAQMDYDVEDGVNQVSFKAKRNNQDKVKNAEPILLTIYYSTDSGASWTPVPEFTDFELPYLATGSSGDGGGSYAFDVTGNPAKYRLKFALAEGSRVPTGTWDAIFFDSVKFLNE